MRGAVKIFADGLRRAPHQRDGRSGCGTGYGGRGPLRGKVALRNNLLATFAGVGRWLSKGGAYLTTAEETAYGRYEAATDRIYVLSPLFEVSIYRGAGDPKHLADVAGADSFGL